MWLGRSARNALLSNSIFSKFQAERYSWRYVLFDTFPELQIPAIKIQKIQWADLRPCRESAEPSQDLLTRNPEITRPLEVVDFTSFYWCFKKKHDGKHACCGRVSHVRKGVLFFVGGRERRGIHI